MATKPTRGQERAADALASALLAIADATRLGGGPRPGPSDWSDLVGRVAAINPAVGRDAIVARAIDARGRVLGLRSGTAELLQLIEEGPGPLDALLDDDEAFRSRVGRAEAELGEV